jgi:8-amino-7-oxononanoate synthase
MFHVKQETPAALQFLDEALLEAQSRNLFRERLPPRRAGFLSFCSNDYLALAGRACPPGPSGAGASRLVAGERPEHVDLERVAAEYVMLPDALVFASGYAANVGLLSSLASPSDRIISDKLNHASLIDGARLSGARIDIVPHLNLEAIERALQAPRVGRAFVVTESYFSMDADAPDLRALRRLCDSHAAALIVDEAHALGVLGPEGRGLCAQAEIQPDALVGTFGKAFGAGGAFVAGCRTLTTWLWNRARPFVFSTGLSPAVAAAAAAGVRAAHAESWRREQVARAAAFLRNGITQLGMRLSGFGHIVPWIVGEPPDALRLAEALRTRGIDVRAIRPPSVPVGTARLRFTVTAAHQPSDLEQAVDAIAAVIQGSGA